MRKLSILFSLLLGVTVAFAQDKGKDDQPKAEISFETIDHDFGKIKEGTMAMYEFKFTNTGKAPLVLSEVRPSCGCTTPEWPKEPIAPGATNKVKAVFNSYARPGVFEKSITVKSNAGTGEIVLRFRGTVEPQQVEPQSPVRNQANY